MTASPGDLGGGLAGDLEGELAEILKEPARAVGFGEKAYMPYELVRGRKLVRSPSTAVTARLLAEAMTRARPRAYRLVMLHLLSQRSDPAVDRALMAALAEPDLRAMAAYLIGRIGFKGYPKRERPITELLAALRPHLADAGSYEDPWYDKRWRTQDFVINAFVRLAGPEHFRLSAAGAADSIGYQLPRLTDDERRSLIAQATPFTPGG